MPPPSSRVPSDPLTDLALWTPVAWDPRREWAGDRLKLVCRSSDPSLESPEMERNAKDAAVLLLRMKASPAKASSSSPHARASLYYATSSEAGFTEERSFHFNVALDGNMREYIVSLPFEAEIHERITRIRFDPLDQPGVCEVERFCLRPGDCLQAKDKELETEERLANDRSVRLQLSRASEVCMGYPEPFWILNDLGEEGSHRLGCFARGRLEESRWEKHLPFPAGVWEEILPRVRRAGLMTTSRSLLEEQDRLPGLCQALASRGCLLDLWTDEHILQAGASASLASVLDRIVLMVGGERPSLPKDISKGLEALLSRGNLRGRPPGVVLGFRRACRSPGDVLALLSFAEDQGAEGVFLPWLEGPQEIDPFWSLAATECRAKGLSLLGPGPPAPKGPDAASTVESPCWCEVPWTRIFLGPEGDVRLCWLHGGVSRTGTVGEVSLFDVWNGEKYRTLRKGMADLPSARQAKPAACSECPFRVKDSFTPNPAKYFCPGP